jgi:predicted PurR-regulated permease PerM
MRTSVRLIAAVAAVAAIWWAKVLLIPLVLGALFSYMLDPLQRRLVAWGVPRRLGAALIVGALVAIVAVGTVQLHHQTIALIERLPTVTDRVRALLRDGWAPTETVGRVQQAANDLQRAAEESAPPVARGVTRVRVETPGFTVGDVLWRGSVGMLEIASQAGLILFLVYYILASGDLYKRKIVRLAGPSLAEKRVTVEVLDEITSQIERFVRARAIISAIVGVSTGIAFWLLGVSHPIVWGIGAGVLNSIPYLGPSAVAVGAAINGLLQFGSGGMAATLFAVSVGIATIEGLILTPWLMGRAGQMSTGAIFVGLSFWGWIWGVWGFLLAVPILMAVKAISDHVGWSLVSELLSD